MDYVITLALSDDTTKTATYPSPEQIHRGGPGHRGGRYSFRNSCAWQYSPLLLWGNTIAWQYFPRCSGKYQCGNPYSTTNLAPTSPKHCFVPLLTLLVGLFLRNRDAITTPSPSTPPPSLPSVGSPSPPLPPPPRAVRRLNITMESHPTADSAARTRSPSWERKDLEYERIFWNRTSWWIAMDKYMNMKG